MGLIDELRDDLQRHGGSLRNLAFWAMATYRFGNWAAALPPGWSRVGGKAYGLLAFAVELTSGITLHREVRIGRDFRLVHPGQIKIHPDTVIGDRVEIMHDVTLGTAGARDLPPTIGNDVFIGAGARVLGPVHIGDGARIAANSLVITDVPPGALAIGVPARVVRYTGGVDGRGPGSDGPDHRRGADRP